ncbi:MAG: hypothetical protein M1817_002233 [Caeruleum heppii]|nr:MAG: hypothetical protein M1817_002233 [Caeruleum heppii]
MRFLRPCRASARQRLILWPWWLLALICPAVLCLTTPANRHLSEADPDEFTGIEREQFEWNTQQPIEDLVFSPPDPRLFHADGQSHKVEDGQSLLTDTVAQHSTEAGSSRRTWLALQDAVSVMQSLFFEVWQGNWPYSSDWTGAVLGTYLSGALLTLSTSLNYTVSPSHHLVTPSSEGPALALENAIGRYFTQLIGYYFGQDVFRLRTEANDDMLWVVLGWLESVKFINTHSSLHYPRQRSGGTEKSKGEGWYGEQYIPAFAHRARIFYDIAARGWDRTRCDGGMIWNPYLRPYKNAITNELFISASIGMYLYFPGDDNQSPFNSDNTRTDHPYDTRYLNAALEAYNWLSTSNMTNTQGLYADGFHISYRNGSAACDLRNEMVYTYNQGVLLSGLRGLWESTGAVDYLHDGHSLVESVIRATGWHAPSEASPLRSTDTNDDGHARWHGLGRSGILEEFCDARGACSQDAQTFKGIFFHHLTLFCMELPTTPMKEGITFSASPELYQWHEAKCDGYARWLEWNAAAAAVTRDEQGVFGMWWGVHRPSSTHDSQSEQDHPLPPGAVDYRNGGVPGDVEWQDEDNVRSPKRGFSPSGMEDPEHKQPGGQKNRDVNDRGRGRTVETQGGGLAVLRAAWEVALKRRQRDEKTS